MIRDSAFPLISINDLASVLEKSQDGIIITDHKGNVVYSTPSADYAIVPHSFSGQNVKDMVDRGVFDHSVIWEATINKSPVTNAVQTKSGSYVVSSATPLLDEKGEVRLVITNVRDDNKLEVYAAALQKASSSVERYKNVINYIQGVVSKSQGIVTRSKKMLQLMEYLRKVATNESPVLITGESGTGKELISSFIHENSLRQREPFIPVNCASIPRDLAESEFFGYAKGAFSGASAQGKPGLFELAHRGTLFLDEIAEMPLDIQAKFLRVLETGSFLRLGGTTPIQTNVRIIAATNRDLTQRIAEGSFREDLYYRLNVIPVEIPPLRERTEDILHLAEHFLKQSNIQYNTDYTLNPEIQNALLEYHWPGNVRELKNYMERYIISPDTGILELRAMSEHPKDKYSPEHKNPSQEENTSMTLKEVKQAAEIAYIKKVMTECNGNISMTARRLGIHRSMLHRKIRDYDL